MARIYLDHAATTPLDADVFSQMIPYFSENFGNPSSLYREGQVARTAIDDARLTISKILDCHLDEIIFTSGATESNNLAIQGVIESWKKNFPEKTPEVIASPLEHSSVKNVLEDLSEKNEILVHWCGVSKEGMVDPEEIKSLLSENTALVTIVAVNNEIGVIQPLSRIGRLCEKNKVPFHIDAVQAFGQIKTSALYWKCDLLSLSAHKFYGPKGAGLLFVKTGTEICEQMLGGGQERHYRSGTENVPAIVGMAAAMEISEKKREEEFLRLTKLHLLARDFLAQNFWKIPEKTDVDDIPEDVIGYKWNGPEISDSIKNLENSQNILSRVPSNLHFSLPEISGESFLMRMDLEGISLSLGSACSAGMMEPSHVLTAIGCSFDEAQTGVRLTFGRETTEDNLLFSLEKILEISKNLKMSQGFFG